jgi:hypothetical protein
MDKHVEEPGEANALALLSVVLLVVIAAFAIMLFIGSRQLAAV